MNTHDIPQSDIGRGVRTGAQFLEELRDGRQVWAGGRKVEDVTTEPGMHRAAQTLADFLDRQHDPAYRDTITYVDDDGDRCALSFKVPKSKEDIVARGRAFYEWATWSHGMLGRTPDYKNASLTALAAAPAFFRKNNNDAADFARNVEDFHTYARKTDRVLTHTLLNPSTSFAQQAEGLQNADVALHVTRETDAGIYVSGARLLATLGPFSDEIEVFPSSFLAPKEENKPFAFAFAIPSVTPGIKMICRDTYDHEKSTFDAPLASRFDEMDAVILFDDVFVPWERLFLYGRPELCNIALHKTNAMVHLMHQVGQAKLAKAEFITGILCAIAQATGRDKDLYTKGQISEVMQMTETVRSLVFAAEQQAHEDEFGNFIPLRGPLDASRNLFPKMYPRMVEILQLLGSSSLMATPADADFGNELQSDVARYFQVAHRDSRARVALFRLAHDVSVSGFGNRQVLYERFFFGPPAFLASGFYDQFDKAPLVDRVDRFLDGSF